MTQPRGTLFPDNTGVLAADLTRPGMLTNQLFEVREAVVRALGEYGAITLHREAQPPANAVEWDFWLTPTAQSEGALTPGDLKVRNGASWVDVTPLTFAAAILARGLPPQVAGVLVSDGTGRLAWADSAHLRQPASFGAVGDGVADDTAALQKLAASGVATISLGAGKTYLVKDTIAFPASCDLDFASSKILYGGPRDRPAVVHGAPGALNRATLSRVNIVSSKTDWSNPNYVGLRVYNLNRGRVTGDMIFGFTIGHEAYSAGQGYTHAYHQILAIHNCKYGTVLTCDGSLPDYNYVNENIWDGGDCSHRSDTNSMGNCYGVWLRAINGGYTGHDMNRWFAPCFQLEDGEPGNERIPFLFDGCGNRCTVIDARYESGRGPFARLQGKEVVLNKLDAGLVSGLYVTPSIVEGGLARFNKGTFAEQLHETSTGSLAVDVFSNVHAYGRDDAAVSGGLHITDASGQPAASVPVSLGIRPRLSSIELASDAVSIGFFVRTVGSETFTLRVDAEPEHTGRLGVALYDESFTQLTDKSATFPDFVYGTFGSDRPYTYSSSFGGTYGGTYKMPSGTLSFRVGPAVRYIRAFVTGKNARIRSIGLDRLSPSGKLFTLFNPLTVRADTRYVGGDPSDGSVGVYATGDILPNAATSETAPAYYQCIRPGRLAQRWSALSSFDIADLVAVGDAVYVCTRAGRSGISGGPTGTSTAIPDGTALWRHLGPKAAFRIR